MSSTTATYAKIVILSLLLLTIITITVSASTSIIYDCPIEEDGSVTSSSKNSTGADLRARWYFVPSAAGYIELNLTEIPDSAVITDVSIEFECLYNYGVPSSDIQIKNCTVRPSTSTGPQIYSNYGTEYDEDYQGHDPGHYNFSSWSALSPASDITAKLSDDWFAFHISPVVHLGTTRYEHWSSTEGVTPPHVWLTYEVNAPLHSSPSPSDYAIDVDMNDTTCITLNHPEGQDMNITWSWWNGTSWNVYGTNNTVTNGTYCQEFLNSTVPCTTYTWRVSTEDEHGNTTNSTYHFTTSCSEPPTNARCSRVNDTAINISWTELPAGAGADVHTVCYYQEGYSTPAWGEGTLGFNTTDEYYVVKDLSDGSCYTFSLWSNVNVSGNWTLSSTRAIVSPCCTSGGEYRIIFRYENTSYDAGSDAYYNNYINFTKFNCSTHLLQVVYPNHYDNYYYINDSWYQNNGNLSYIDINVTEEPLWIDFHWNWSVDTTCSNCSYQPQYHRRLTPYSSEVISGNDTITFYMITDNHVYNEFYGYNKSGNCTQALEQDLKDNIVLFDFQFEDRTHIFDTQYTLDSRARFWTVNTTKQLVIHEEYWDASQQVHPYLVFQKKYFTGINCSDTRGKYYENVGVAPNQQWVYPYEARTIIINLHESTWTDYSTDYTIDYGWKSGGTGLWVYYYDTTLNTNTINCTIFNSSGGQVYTSEKSQNEFNFTFNTANQSHPYQIYLTIDDNDMDNDIIVSFWIFPGENTLTTAETINTTLAAIFGQLPSRTYGEGQSYTMNYTNIVMFALVFIVFSAVSSMLSIGSGILAGGVTMLGFSGLVYGMLSIYPYTAIFFILIGILVLFGGER